jgi:predicted ATPase/class 3 adenylate cyclase
MSTLPRGTVTFLFTDIEDSTRLWQRFPNLMPTSYALHDAILRGAIEASSGVVYKTIGDAFQAVFPTAPHAVEAAMIAQQQLHAAQWPTPEPLRVRMALHSGAVEPDGAGDYRSPVLNRLGRLLAAGHGGQILLSGATLELVQDHLPPGASIRDLGDHRLKDLYRPERVGQMVATGLPDDFAALRTLDHSPNNLPAQVTRFIGRHDAANGVHRLLRRPDVRLVTLTGPGGMGKTRLALQVAADLLDDFADGVCLVELAAVTDPHLATASIGRALGIQERPDIPIAESIQKHLRDRALLLVLDNMEQVLDSGVFVGELLASCPWVKVLATSRIRLQLRGEYDFPLPPLEVPDPNTGCDLAMLMQCESVRLFVERAQAVLPGFALSHANAWAVTELCARLDGLPLAIELAAARVRMLPPEAMLARFGGRLPLLTGGPKDGPVRQQTLRNAIAWSYELLAPADQALFRRLAVFSGGWTLDAACAVCVDDPDADLFDGLERLVDQSLVRQTEVDGEPRFTMLETIGEFGLEQLHACGEYHEARQRHARYVAKTSELSEPEPPSSELGRWLDNVEREYANVRAACEWTLDNDVALAVRLTGYLGKYWIVRGHVSEGLSWIERAAQAEMADVPIADRARCLRQAASLAALQGDFGRGWAWNQAALRLYEELGDRRQVVLLLTHLSSCADAQHLTREATLLWERAIHTAREIDDHDLLSYALNVAGYMSYLHGDLPLARVHLEEALNLARARDDMYLPLMLHSCGDLCRAEGNLDQAAALYRECLARAMDCKLGLSISAGLIGLAMIRTMTRQPERAALLFGAEDRFRRTKGFSVDHDLAHDYEHHLSLLRDELGVEVFEKAWANGGALSLEEAIVEAMMSSVDVSAPVTRVPRASA